MLNIEKIFKLYCDYLDKNLNKRVLKLYKTYLGENLKELKRVECTETKSKIKSELGIKTTSPVFDSEQRLVSIYDIIATMLGIIDARNSEYKRQIEFYRNLIDDEEISETVKKQSELEEYREMILNDYFDILPKGVDDFPVINETFITSPSYKYFNKLFKHIEKNDYKLSIQENVVDAYMLGYKHSLCIYPDQILPYYRKVIAKYKAVKEKNNFNIQKVKYLTSNTKK